MKSFWPPLPSPESGRAVTFLLVNTGPTRAISFFFFFLSMPFIERAPLYVHYISEIRIFPSFFPSSSFFRANTCNKLRRVRAPSPASISNGIDETEEGEPNKYLSKEKLQKRHQKSELGGTLHIVDPWLMYRLSYRQAVLSSSCRFLDLRSP